MKTKINDKIMNTKKTEEKPSPEATSGRVLRHVMPSDIDIISIVESHDEKGIRRGDLPHHVMNLYDGEMDEVVECRTFNHSINLEFYAPRGMFKMRDKFEFEGLEYVIREKCHTSMGMRYTANALIA